jgi:Xaa-Pro aminopeptidase
MLKAQEITDKAFAEIITRIKPGMTELELQAELIYCLYKNGGQGLAFDPIVVSGPNTSLPHGVAGDRVICQGDFVTMDFGAMYQGYCADMTRTVAFGEPSPEMRRIYETVLRAQTMCEDALAAGKNCFDIDRLARDYIDARGYAGRFGHGLGHSVGIDIHEEPRLSPSCQDILKAGIVITVEPGVYIPGVGGCRIEDTVIMTSEGCVNAMHAPKHLIEL